MQIQYSIFTYPVIQSRGEEQGRATGGGEASGRKEQRAGEGTDLGGLGWLQGGAATGGGRVPCREADGKPTVPCRRRTLDGSPAGRRSCRVGGGQGPCRPQGGLGAAGGGGATRVAEPWRQIRRCATDCAAQTVLGPSSNSRAGNSFPAPFFPSSRSRANVFFNVCPKNATLPHRSAFNLD